MTIKEAIQKTRELIEKQGTVAKGTFHDGKNFCARGALLYVAGRPGAIRPVNKMGPQLGGFSNANSELIREIFRLAHTHRIFLQEDNDERGYRAVIADLKKLEKLAA